LKRKRRGYWGGWIGKYWDTPAPCSGSCCGNPRRWFGEKTAQERRAEMGAFAFWDNPLDAIYDEM